MYTLVTTTSISLFSFKYGLDLPTVLAQGFKGFWGVTTALKFERCPPSRPPPLPPPVYPTYSPSAVNIRQLSILQHIEEFGNYPEFGPQKQKMEIKLKEYSF